MEEKDLVTIEDFGKLALRVAKIKEVNDHPHAAKLYVLTIDTGNEEKQIVAGIKNFYTRDELLGKTIVIVDNMKPAVLRNVESKAMLLAAKDEDTLGLVTIDRPVRIGSKIT
jgi:methionyl-tRNA synthetase